MQHPKYVTFYIQVFSKNGNWADEEDFGLRQFKITTGILQKVLQIGLTTVRMLLRLSHAVTSEGTPMLICI